MRLRPQILEWATRIGSETERELSSQLSLRLRVRQVPTRRNSISKSPSLQTAMMWQRVKRRISQKDILSNPETARIPTHPWRTIIPAGEVQQPQCRTIFLLRHNSKTLRCPFHV